MDFLSLNTEIDSREDFNKNAENSLKSLNNFFSSLQKSYYQFYINTYSSLQLLFNHFVKFDNKSSYSKKFFEFYRSFDKYLSKLHIISIKITKELIEPTELIISHLREKNINELTEFRTIIDTTIEQKKKYEISKHSYYDACKIAEVEERKLNKDDTNILNKVNDECKKYKDEHKKTNELYEQNEKIYFPLIERLKDNEESRITFITYHFEKLMKMFEDQENAFTNMMKSIKESVVEVKINDDMILYEEKFSYVYKNKQRLLREELILFDVYKKNIETMIKNNSIIFKQGGFPIPLPSMDISFDPKSFNKIPLEQNDEIVFSSLFSFDVIEKKQKKLLVNFENRLKTEEYFAKRIIDKLLIFFKVNIFYKFENYSKFELLASFLIDVCMNGEVRKKLFDLNFAVVFIAEKTFYQKKDGSEEKVYMCKYLSDNYQNFKSKIFWKKLLEMRIVASLDEYKKKTLKKTNLSNKDNPSLSSDTSQNKEEIEKTVNEFKKKEVFNLIKGFIHHFTNFNLDMTESNDIIIEIANDYNLTKEETSFFVCYLNSNMYTVKSNRIYRNIKNTFIYTNKNFKNYLLKKKIKNNANKDLKKFGIILTSSYNFLSLKDYIQILRLNKLYNLYGQRNIFKQLLLRDNNTLTFAHHSQIWKYLFKYNKNLLIYSKVVKSSKSFVNPVIDIIKLDVLRTPFEINKQQNKRKLQEILIALTYQYQTIGYCQGMNYICAFFLSITQSESESFHNFSSFLSKTEYGNLMLNDFELLKKYFYIFDRLVSIYLPEVFAVLKRNNISSSYYISPWLITLYTNCYSYLPANQTPKTLIRIFDLFALDGWYAILRVGLCLLKHFEKNIFELKFDELLTFIINDIIKFDFFQLNNFDRFNKLYEEMKLHKGLISNLENEYEIEKKVKVNKDKK